MAGVKLVVFCALLGACFAAGVNNRVASTSEGTAAEENAKTCASNSVPYGLEGVAERAVTQRLKSPSTAKFPGWGEDRVAVTVNRETCVLTVSGWVDAQNAFGAMIRKTWIAHVRMVDVRHHEFDVIDAWVVE